MQMWLAAPKLVGKSKDILRFLVGRHPNTFNKAEIADAVQMSEGAGGFNNYMATLKKAGLIDKNEQGHFKASDALFP
jgi:predicted transcriptional regulator